MAKQKRGRGVSLPMIGKGLALAVVVIAVPWWMDGLGVAVLVAIHYRDQIKAWIT